MNIPPKANAGLNQEIRLPRNSTGISGAGSVDSDGYIVKYQWTKISGPDCIILFPNRNETPVTNLSQGIYVFRLTVTDNAGDSGYDDIIITVE